jgi:hypothetical protein
MEKLKEWGGIIVTIIVMAVNIGLIYGNLSKDIEMMETNVNKNEVKIESVLSNSSLMKESIYELKTEFGKMNTKLDFVLKKLDRLKE